jgi:hypothetical protein
MKPTRIKSPTYKVGRYTLTEYELRNLCVEVGSGLKPAGIRVTDIKGNVAYIKERGQLSADLHGLDLMTSYKLELMRLRHPHFCI